MVPGPAGLVAFVVAGFEPLSVSRLTVVASVAEVTGNVVLAEAVPGETTFATSVSEPIWVGVTTMVNDSEMRWRQGRPGQPYRFGRCCSRR